MECQTVLGIEAGEERSSDGVGGNGEGIGGVEWKQCTKLHLCGR